MFSNHPRLRLGVYITSLVFAVAAPFVAVGFPDYGSAAVTASSLLAVAAGVTAASNLEKKEQ